MPPQEMITLIPNVVEG